MFLFDRNCAFLGDNVAGPRESDRAIVTRAFGNDWTVVTNNAVHLLREFRLFQRKLQRDECHELFGLVIVPNTQLEAERFWNSMKRGIRTTMGKKVAWRYVQAYNLVVGPPDERGRARLRRFALCAYCSKDGFERPHWVEALPLVR